MLALITQFTQIVHIPVLHESYAQNKKCYKAWNNSSQRCIVLKSKWKGIQILRYLLAYHQLQGTR